MGPSQPRKFVMAKAAVSTSHTALGLWELGALVSRLSGENLTSSTPHTSLEENSERRWVTNCTSFQDCCAKVSQIGRLGTAETRYLTVLEAGSQQLRSQQGWFPLRALNFRWRPGILGVPWFVGTSLQPLASVFTWCSPCASVSLRLKRAPVTLG